MSIEIKESDKPNKQSNFQVFLLIGIAIVLSLIHI